MNQAVLKTLSDIAQGVDLCTAIEKAYVKEFKRALSVDLFVASTFTGKRDSNETIELVAKWDKDNAAAKRDVEWIKAFNP